MRFVCWLVLSLTAWAAAWQRAARPLMPRAHRPPPLRIYKGQDDTHDIYPYVVTLCYGKFLIRSCTGTLVTPDWVLTAAHCLNAGLVAVKYGNQTLQSTTISIVLDVVPHPNVKIISHALSPAATVYLRHDIALLKVEAVRMRVYANISAIDYRALTGHAVQYAGFGVTFKESMKNRKEIMFTDLGRALQVGEGVVVPCERRNTCNLLNVAPKCANKEQHVLPGDSGGPLFYAGSVVGVANSVSSPMSYYTPVSPYLSWINSVITKDKTK